MISRLIDYPGPLWRPYAAFANLLVVLWVIIGGPFVILLCLSGKRAWTTFGVTNWNRVVVRIFRLKLNAKIDPSYDPTQPCLLVCNHQSHVDVPIIFEALSGHVRMLAKKELFRIPIFGHALAMAEFIPVDRGNREAGREVTKKISRLINSGLQVWLAPEGTRSPDGKLQAFKSGSFSVAIEAKVPIQPLVVKNAYRILAKNEYLVKIGSTLDFEALPQIVHDGESNDNRRHLAETTRTAIAACLDDYNSKNPE